MEVGQPEKFPVHMNSAIYFVESEDIRFHTHMMARNMSQNKELSQICFACLMIFSDRPTSLFKVDVAEVDNIPQKKLI